MTSAVPETELPPDHLLRQLLDAITAHPEVREPLLRALLTEDFLTLPNRVDKLQSEFEEFREETRAGFRAVNERIDETNSRLGETNSRLGETNSRLDETNSRLGETNSRLDGINSRLDDNTRSIRRLEGHVGRLIGRTYEEQCRYEIGAILDGWLVVGVLADRQVINAKLLQARENGSITRDEYLNGLRPDIVARENRDLDHTGILAVVEASVTFNRGDLENAARRAAIVANVTGNTVAAFVITHEDWPEEVNATAEALGVTIIRHEDPYHEGPF